MNFHWISCIGVRIEFLKLIIAINSSPKFYLVHVNFPVAQDPNIEANSEIVFDQTISSDVK